MDFRIADTFTDSLARLSGDEQKLVKTTAFDLQLNPASPGMSVHRLDQTKDKNFWSVRASSDLRLIVHRTDSSLLLCYAGHHDDAYRWAERRKLETHPKTGAAQFVEIRERVEEVAVPVYQVAPKMVLQKPPLFEKYTDEVLLGYGVPPEWLADVRAANEDSLLELADHLPAEAAEALLELATGSTPRMAPRSAAGAVDPFAHPDAQRRFRLLSDVEELARALDYPWEKWTIFLHPSQRQLVEKEFGGPARVGGSAGTGKTIVALHRAVFLAHRDPNTRVLLTTFSVTLANALRTKLRRLISNAPSLGERLEVHAIDAMGERLFERSVGPTQLASREIVVRLLDEAARASGGHKFSPRFLLGEWDDVVDAWQLDAWEAYRDVRRLGRKTRLSEQQRRALWEIFERVRAGLGEQKLRTRAAMFTELAQVLATRSTPPFDYAVVDEAQDINIPQLRFLAALGGGRPNGLFFAGDLGQRIFQQAFSWKALGVEVRGRAHTLRVNYRTSHQIRAQADRLLALEISDVDGNREARKGTVSVFNGPAPTISSFDSPEAESAAVAQWLKDRAGEGFAPHEIGIFVRSENEIERARNALDAAGLSYRVLDEHVATSHGMAAISTMHLAKGLEFRAVAVMACDDEIIPQQSRLETVADDADLTEVYETERHLLYVACTRARDRLLITSGDVPSEFLDDLRGE